MASSPHPPNPSTHAHSSPIALGCTPVEVTPRGVPFAQTIISTAVQSKLTELKSALRTMRASLSGLPPIKSAINGLERCLAHIQIGEQTRHEYEDVVSRLTNLANLIQKNVVEKSPSYVPHSIANVARAIEELTSVIGGCQDIEAVLKYYCKVDISSSTWDVFQEQQMDTRLERLLPAYDAYYNAALSSSVAKRTGCTEGTRIAPLTTVQTWIHEADAAKIYWLNGMAGTGKTTIAYSVCEMLQKKYQLGGSFFCSRNSPDCRDVNRIVPTIAYQLGRYSNAYRKALFDVLRNDPDTAKRNISTQFKQLVLGPLVEMGEAMPADVVIVIDALDECTDVDGTRDVLSMLLQYAGDLPIKFFVSSRPEPEISECMAASDGAMRSIIWLHDIEQSQVQADIKLYLTQALKSVRLSSPEIDLLTAHAGCLFIFAATVVRYILPAKGSVNPTQRIQTVLGLRPDQSNKVYQDIDELYATILSNALDEKTYEESELTTRRQVLRTVICAREPLSISALGEVLNLPDEKSVQIMIQPLQSVLHVSDSTDVVSTLHASFPDFLLNEKRAGQFYCNEIVQNSYLAEYCFRLMGRSLKFNICGLKSSYHFDRDVPGLQDRLTQQVPAGLFYSCQYWGDHMTRNSPTYTSLLLLESFLQQRLLVWMEVMNLRGRIGQGENILSQILGWLPSHDESTELQDFTYDARNFLTTFAGNPTSLSTPHIYVSVLPFTSKQSLVHKTYWPQTQGLIRVDGAAMEVRRKSALATWAVEGAVNTLALSKDGRRVVSGSDNNEVSVWDVSSGTRILGPLAGHTERVWSVAYSPDNNHMASGSYDDTIRIWHAEKGQLITGRLLGHSESVYSVAFSVDGAYLASGSEDSTIRVWDADTGAPVGDPLEGQWGAVWSIAFSPDGQRLASGSRDSVIRVWDWQRSLIAGGQLEGHTDAVYSIAYASDGGRLASGSGDQTVRVWDMLNGTLLAGPFGGHTGAVWCVSFSPNGTRVVSGSHDRTIRIWEAMSGVLVAGPFEGHGGAINSVLFTADGTRILSGSDDDTICVWDARQEATGVTESLRHTGGTNSVILSPNGTRAASGSNDSTICVWDTHNGSLVGGPIKGHPSTINSVAFSPDGARIVSGSGDHALRIWDTSAGTILVGPIEGHTRLVQSVAFSPDGSRIASGSKDRTIRLWNSHTGALVAEPFTGHTNTVASISFSPDGARIFSGSWDERVRMWDANNGTTLWASEAHTNWVNCVAFSLDGARVVSGSDDYAVLVMDASDGAVLHGPFTGHTHFINSVAFSPDGRRVVSGSKDKTVRVWDVESGTMAAGPLERHTGGVGSVAFFPDGTRIVSGSADGTTRIWDLDAITQASPSADDWSIDDDGWLTDSHAQRLFWVPPDLRHAFGFLTAANPTVINADCTIRIGPSTLLGDRWHECYGISSVGASSYE